MNNITLYGRLAGDVELKVTQSGKKVANFCLAVRRKNVKEGERDADFINCVAWEKAGELVEKYVSKGDRFAVRGALQYSERKNDDGKTTRYYYVLVEDFYFVESKKTDDPMAGAEDVVPDEGDIPF